MARQGQSYDTDGPAYELSRVNNEDSLVISSEGTSLRSVTRNYPHHPGGSESSSKKLGRRKSHMSALSQELDALYRQIGQSLSSPEPLEGAISLAHISTKRSSSVRHFYKRRRYLLTTILAVSLFLSLFAIFVILDERDEHEYAYIFLGVALGGSVVFVLGMLVVLYALPRCTKTLLLRSQLESMEEYIKLCEVSDIEYNKIFDEIDFGACDYKLVGSAGDGFGFFSSQGSNRHLFQKQAVLTQDIDVNIFLNHLVPDHHQVIPVPRATGFTFIRLTQQEADKIADPVIKASLVESDSGDFMFLSAAAISKEASKYFKPTNETQIIEHFPALTLKMTTPGPNGTQDFEADYAFALRYPYWPEIASEWVDRERFGLDKATVEKIAGRGCYLVHKPCGQNSFEHDHSFDWRFTFASAEADLFHYHKDKRALKLAYVLLKFMIKFLMKPKGIFETFMAKPYCCGICAFREIASNKKEISVLRTYHLKTVFLWVAEEETDLDYYNIKGNKTLGNVFLRLLDRYIICVKSRTLPNYFISCRNMLSGDRYSNEDFVNGLSLLKKIRNNPTFHIVFSFERQFINKKLIVSVVIIGMITLFISQTLSDLFNNGFTITNLNGGNRPVYIDVEIFTQRYVDHLEDLYKQYVRANS